MKSTEKAKVGDENLGPFHWRNFPFGRRIEKAKRRAFDGPQSPNDFISWGRRFTEELANPGNTSSLKKLVLTLLASVRWLGANEDVVKRVLSENKRELMDPFLGEIVAVLSLVFGWKNKQKEEFSQALGEIGALGVLTAKPLILIIAVCGLALGYQKYFHKESLKKGGVIGVVGTTTAFLIPGTALSTLTALVLVLFMNQNISVDRPVETQIKECVEKLSYWNLTIQSQKFWKVLDNFFNDLLKSPSGESIPGL